MTDTDDVKERVNSLHGAIFGIEGQGGLYREVESMKAQVIDHEKRINAVSTKWLLLMFLAGVVGNALGSSGVQALVKSMHLLP